MKHNNNSEISELEAFKRFLEKELPYIQGRALKTLIYRFMAQIDMAHTGLKVIYMQPKSNVINLDKERQKRRFK